MMALAAQSYRAHTFSLRFSCHSGSCLSICRLQECHTCQQQVGSAQAVSQMLRHFPAKHHIIRIASITTAGRCLLAGMLAPTRVHCRLPAWCQDRHPSNCTSYKGTQVFQMLHPNMLQAMCVPYSHDLLDVIGCTSTRPGHHVPCMHARAR